MTELAIVFLAVAVIAGGIGFMRISREVAELKEWKTLVTEICRSGADQNA